jgi:hypothetical protein
VASERQFDHAYLFSTPSTAKISVHTKAELETRDKRLVVDICKAPLRDPTNCLGSSMMKRQIASITAALVALTTGLLQSEQVNAAELPSNGLVLWLDATDASSLKLTNGQVDSWRNKAPGFQSQFKSRKDHYPRYRNAAESGMRPALRFDGRDDVLADGQFNHQMKTWTLAVVAAPFPSN